MQPIQELSIRWRFDYVDDCLERIDEHLRVLVEQGGRGARRAGGPRGGRGGVGK